MPYDIDDTIAAIASAPGPSARSIVRISGRATRECLIFCFPDLAAQLSATRAASVYSGSLNCNGRALECDVYYWPNERSYTREPSAELHLSASPPLVQRALENIMRSGARMAEPGEFTLRAFLAGRIDLTQAEAVLGVIEATDRARLDVALAQLAGGLSQPLHDLREQLLDLLAHIEAGLDFVEEDIEFITSGDLSNSLQQSESAIRDIAVQLRERTVDSQQPRVVLRGLPNAGKSSLFNALLSRKAAIVSAQQGTTRDYLHGTLNLGDQLCLLIDTAGIDALATDPIHRSAQDFMRQQAQAADLEILCLDGARGINAAEDQLLHCPATTPRIVVRTKSDLDPSGLGPAAALRVSSQTGEGLAQLRELICDHISDHSKSPTAVASTAARCREILFHAADCLQRARDIHTNQAGEELIAAELRLALDALGRVIGAVYTDDVLDRIFSRFCIGK